jgi:biopolymer transport protein ExbD
MSMFDSKRSVDDKIPTSSMADIAFLLLVFFLVTTVFPKDKGLAVVLPQDVTTPVPAKNVLHLLISPSGMVEVRRGDSQNVQHVRADDVAALWSDAVAANPLLIAAVKTHPDAEYRHMMNVLDALHGARAQRVSLQTLNR